MNKQNAKSTDPTRDIAFQILFGVICKHQNFDVISSKFTKNASYSASDKKAAYRLVMASLREYGYCEKLLKQFIKKKPPPNVQIALTMGVVQILFLKTPHYAAVNTILQLLKRQHLTKFVSLSNAVLRNIIRKKELILQNIDARATDNIPSWLVKSWDRFSKGTSQKIAAMLAKRPPLDITYTLNSKNHVPPDAQHLTGNIYRLFNNSAVETLEGYPEGDFWVQDIAASYPAHFLNGNKGEIIADLCAAPGGKTAQLCQTGAQIVSIDKNTERVRILKENMKRLHFSPRIIQDDVNELSLPSYFDAILLDAPCSGTGIIRRHPDILLNKTPKDVLALTKLQARLLETSWKLLKRGGRLIYCVCSLQKEEGENQLQTALQLGFKHVPFTQQEMPFIPAACTKEGFYRTFPYYQSHIGGMDGFFAMQLIKP